MLGLQWRGEDQCHQTEVDQDRARGLFVHAKFHIFFDAGIRTSEISPLGFEANFLIVFSRYDILWGRSCLQSIRWAAQWGTYEDVKSSVGSGKPSQVHPLRRFVFGTVSNSISPLREIPERWKNLCEGWGDWWLRWLFDGSGTCETMIHNPHTTLSKVLVVIVHSWGMTSVPSY